MLGEYDSGFGTSPDMWRLLSDLLDGEKLPESLNEAIYKLCDGVAYVAIKSNLERKVNDD